MPIGDAGMDAIRLLDQAGLELDADTSISQMDVLLLVHALHKAVQPCCAPMIRGAGCSI